MGAAAQRRGAASRPQPSPGRDQGAPKAHGPVAQLVEQRVYTAAVVGSNPAGSTEFIEFSCGRHVIVQPRGVDSRSCRNPGPRPPLHLYALATPVRGAIKTAAFLGGLGGETD